MALSSSIGLFYGSSTCYTEICAEKIQHYLGETHVDLLNVEDSPISKMNEYSFLILGIPTWDYGELQEDWENCWDEIDNIDFKHKTVALFGLGDQVGYPEWFLDAMGYLHNKALVKGANIVGYWPNTGYQFTGSQALTEDHSHFVGLALDDENQFEKTDIRIAQWCDQLKKDFKIS